MSCVTQSKEHVPAELKRVYQLVREELQQVSDLLQEELSHENPFIQDLTHYCFQLGGKRLRPLLVLLTGKILGSLRREHLLAATALEMIHTGTLLHDDILDRAHFRRHLETVNQHWDTQVAVLGGDLLLMKAMRLVTQCHDAKVDQMITDACFSTLEGELSQIASQNNFELTEDEYLKIVGGKTAALLKCCCQLGAYLSGSPQNVLEGFELFGEHLGIAFQITDDVLDLIGNERKTGKTLGTDLLNHKLTLPLIYYLKKATPADQKKMRSLIESSYLTSDDVHQVRQMLLDSSSIQDAFFKANSLLEEGILAVQNVLPTTSFSEDVLPADFPLSKKGGSFLQNEYLAAFLDLTHFVTTRSL